MHKLVHVTIIILAKRARQRLESGRGSADQAGCPRRRGPDRGGVDHQTIFIVTVTAREFHEPG